MVELKMFNNKYFSFLVVIGVIISFSLGSYIYFSTNFTSHITYITLFLLMIYTISNVIVPRYDRYFYVIYILFFSIILFSMSLYFTALFTVCVVIPTYLFLERIKISRKYKIYKRINRHFVISRRRYVIKMSIFMILFILINIVFFLLKKQEYVYDFVTLFFLVLTFINTLKNNQLQWIYRCLYSFSLLFFFNTYRIDFVLIIMEIFFTYLSLLCFFTYTVEKEFKEMLK